MAVGFHVDRGARNAGKGFLVEEIWEGEGLLAEHVECEAPLALSGVLGDGRDLAHQGRRA